MAPEPGVASDELAVELARVCADAFAEPWSPELFERELARPEGRLELERAPAVGVVAYGFGWRVLDEVQIFHVAVDARFRRRGLARRLLDRWFARLRAEGVRSVTLEVRASNRAARALYRALGLQEQGVRRRYYSDGETAVLVGGEL
jgi:ribosomal-protein-alanine N-acetyltransferase